MALGFGDSTTLVCLGTTTTELLADSYDKVNFGDLTTLVSLQTSLTESIADASGDINKNTVESLFTTTVSTATTSMAPDINVRLDATRDYVSSMSVQEIDQMLVELDEQENKILNAVDETAKVKTLGSKTKF